MGDPYQVLGLERNCSDEDIKKAYKRMALKYHPDKNKNDRENAEVMFKAVAQAYNILRDPKQRRQYDLYGESGLNSGGGGDYSHVNAADIFAQFFGDFGGMGGFGSMGHGMGGFDDGFDHDYFMGHGQPRQTSRERVERPQHQQGMHQSQTMASSGMFPSMFDDPFFGGGGFGFGGGGFHGMSTTTTFSGSGSGMGGMSYSKSQSTRRDRTGRVVTKTVEVKNGIRTETETVDGGVISHSIDGVPQNVNQLRY